MCPVCALYGVLYDAHLSTDNELIQKGTANCSRILTEILSRVACVRMACRKEASVNVEECRKVV